MADALVSPVVGGAFWAASGGLLAFCARRLRQAVRDDLVPMMGVLGAFVFAAQMINFAIPGTGSSGHLGGGLLLAVLLGPYAAFLVMASVLTVQAFCFADGGLLALGCNMFNLGFFPALVAYPLIYRPMTRGPCSERRIWLAAIVAGIAGLQLGALCVVVQTTASGISELPWAPFLLLMQPIHLAIGIVEGVATSAVVAFLARARPDALPDIGVSGASRPPRRALLAGFALAALLIGGVFSWFASTHPDGLEWAMARAAGKEEVAGLQTPLHQGAASVQESTALLPDYAFRTAAEEDGGAAATSLAGVAGGVATLLVVCVTGLVLKAWPAQRRTDKG